MAIRIFVEKRPGFRVEAESLLAELNSNLSLNLAGLRLVNVYDLDGFSRELLEKCRYSVFGETVTDTVTDSFPLEGKRFLCVEYLPGQFDQRASSAEDCVLLMDPSARVRIKSSRLLVFEGDVPESALDAVRHYFINPVESREKDLSRLSFLDSAEVAPERPTSGFTAMKREDYPAFRSEWGLAMSDDDLDEVVRYFTAEGRNPTETELRILDTYWSDHCRHTTFTTRLTDVSVEDSFIREDIEKEIGRYHSIRLELGRDHKPVCLMDLATIGARYLRSKGLLDDLEVSGENNACSIFVDVDVDGAVEKWLLQFKNETHNHPTEIEPFGGASTCLGGAIRDPLSGRAYVYQAMRVTGAGNIWAGVGETLHGKLPQRVISRKAAAGYSSYGNQIGLATTCVKEIYHPGYTAKRLEVGAVVGAVKASSVRREEPSPGDVVLLLGGRTGRDGIGGATGSSKEHNESSLEKCGSEVQKGNAPEERKLQRLFRRSEVAAMIKKSNDFGAGGVSVAIGELAAGLDIYLDRVPVKYAGLNPTELAISESQERMAVVISASDKDAFMALCHRDNVEVTHVADVTATGRMTMYYKGSVVADLSRGFIDSAGAPRHASACIGAVPDADPFVREVPGKDLESRLGNLLSDDNVTLQKGLVEMFDASIGRSTVLMPYGGSRQLSETRVSVQKLPADGHTETASMMAFGYDPELSSWSPYHGAAYAVVEACSKVVAAGGDFSTMRFSYQEYFERMTSDPHTWGKPMAALLGALKMQVDLGLPSIGGKDSMSGSFREMGVPPTLIAFGITTLKASDVISTDLKAAGNKLYIVRHNPLGNHMPDTGALVRNWNNIHDAIVSGKIVSAWAAGYGGAGEALVKMAAGNGLGFDVTIPEKDLFRLPYGSVIVESAGELDFPGAVLLGTVTDRCFVVNGIRLSRTRMEMSLCCRFDKVYPSVSVPDTGKVEPLASNNAEIIEYKGERVESPVVYLPVFPGTNCDYDSAKAFREAGATVISDVFLNLTGQDVMESIGRFCSNLSRSHILMLSGGFSLGDEPDGSGKFIASVLCNASVAAAVESLLSRGGLVLGICNGFQALVKSGLLPFGKAGNVTVDSPTLFRNDINRHVSQMVTTRVASVSSPWLKGFIPGQLHTVAVSHGEGKFVVGEEMARRLFASGQVAFQYADPFTGEATMESPCNPNGSCYAIEGIVSPDGQILGKMGHSERFEDGNFKNIPGNLDQPLFRNAVNYFRKIN
ncbi:MAG: phosphoribosylformylglycinamidine synthase [Bacteroidales bacterium]|nr:phosphoribosylformylglycinamidine synthase [Bacteroidales bacterium]